MGDDDVATLDLLRDHLLGNDLDTLLISNLPSSSHSDDFSPNPNLNVIQFGGPHQLSRFTRRPNLSISLRRQKVRITGFTPSYRVQDAIIEQSSPNDTNTDTGRSMGSPRGVGTAGQRFGDAEPRSRVCSGFETDVRSRRC
ncbi:uncharacterized protein A4U43_C10F8040 [Asparagus officinalis]|uniref:Uncharacterized protein n=1 Tax=Asparagus officinalis TaxID=4686 RepID=A0A5P1E1B2_ASPOF|nr:uncharacterized protein A4U43_C10F8040 [Asparagus officinalis]